MLLNDTDWASLATVCGTGESLPAALARLLDPDPAVTADAAGKALGEVTHQNTLYEATVPVALYVASILDEPGVSAGDFGPEADMPPPRRPTLVRLLRWLGDTAYDADDACLAIAERRCCEPDPHENEEMRAFRDLRPAIFSAVRPLLDHHSADVREAAFVAAAPLAEHPLLAERRSELAGHARHLLATSADRRSRDRALDALKAWGHDTNDLENPSDVAARERYARLRAERSGWDGGYSKHPPF
ncbi:hypothetical protein [Streptomyces sp. NPDC001741]|uniref:hypothetical protein n=1 Tax=Streptomyces sp. NPDC001741 TaxID=3364605 RepID=UPI0036779F3F